MLKEGRDNGVELGKSHLAVVDSSHTGVVARRQVLLAVRALEATSLVEHLLKDHRSRFGTREHAVVCQCVKHLGARRDLQISATTFKMGLKCVPCRRQRSAQ